MDEIVRDCIVSLTTILAIAGILYVFLMTRHRERMALMERGLSPDQFSNKKNIFRATLRYGLLGVGIAIGFLMSNFVNRHFDVPINVAFLSMIFFFGGISLIVSFLIDRKLND